MKREYVVILIFIIISSFVWWKYWAMNVKINDLENRNMALKHSITICTGNEISVVNKYKEELKLWMEKQELLDWLPFANTKLYLEWELSIQGIQEIDDKILEIRSARLLEEKGIFPYKEGLGSE